MSSKRNQTIAIARFLMYKYGLNQQLEGMTDEEYLAHPIGLDVGEYVADLMKYCPEHIVDQVMEHQDVKSIYVSIKILINSTMGATNVTIFNESSMAFTKPFFPLPNKFVCIPCFR